MYSHTYCHEKHCDNHVYLAGYNLGEGKVGRLIQMADEAGLDATRWDNVAQMLPPGHHTVKYVENVLDTYTRYSREYAQ